MNFAEANAQAVANQQALAAADRERAEKRRESRAERERAQREAEAALRKKKDEIEASATPKPGEFPTWGVLPRGRGLARFLHLQKERDDAVGSFARQALADDDFPADPTTIRHYLVVKNAPCEMLSAASEAVLAYRAWWREGFEAALRDIPNPERAAQVRERHREAIEAVDRLFAEDAAS